jgi:ATP-binding cassette subfamily F protein 3
MIIVENLFKRYGKQQLFDRVGFKVNRRERVGVVGRNGHGKSTLFRLISGLEEADEGTISKPKNYTLGYVQQELLFSRATVLQEAAAGLPAAEADQVWKAEKILAGLGFESRDLERPPGELSGGFQVRLNLAKVLLAEPNLLLLDEPNNFLDITSIRWLARHLTSWPGELMLITHDRSFMDQVVTHVLGIHRRRVRKIAGNTAKYYNQIAQDEETYEKTRINDERKAKEIEDFIAKFRASARLQGLVESRKKTLAKMGKKEKLEKIATLDFAFTPKTFHGKYVMSAEGLSFGYEPDRPLFRDLTITVGRRDRIFVIGPNGRGKTTLLKLLAGILQPGQGQVSLPLNVEAGYFEQSNVRTLNDSNTVLDEVASALAQADQKKARFLCGSMMFEGEDALKRISILSGGEKSRVMLAKIIGSPTNLLLLDEPTNHLDMDSSDALLEALDAFEGAVIMVTHNEMFLNALAERLIVFEEGGAFVFEGGYQWFLEKVGWKEEAVRPSAGTGAERSAEAASGPVPQARPKIPKPAGRREERRRRSELQAERARLLKSLEKKIMGLEKILESGQSELERMNLEVAEASRLKDSPRIVELSKAIHRRQEEANTAYRELESVLGEYESRRADFDSQLASADVKTDDKQPK